MLIKYKEYCVYSLLASSVFLFIGGCSIEDYPEVLPANHAPKITSDAKLSARVDIAYNYILDYTDEDSGDVLVLSASTLPEWLAFNTVTGELTGTPSETDMGSHSVTLTVDDGREQTNQEFSITVAEAFGNWQMVWSDEFEGGSLNGDNWNIETGDGSQYGIPGWGNNELEWYSADNISVSEGNLVITATEQATNGYDYSSGRIRSDNKVDILYGRIEARIQVPAGQGLWSAFWMLPTDSLYGGWASGGEIDIMEAVNQGIGTGEKVFGTVHYGMAWPMNVMSTSTYEVAPADDFHLYAIEWEQGQIRWYIDNVHYATVTSDHWWSYYFAGLNDGYVSSPTAPFDQDFHLLFNLAVGGNLPGSPDANTVFPAELLVDYVRVYQCDSEVGCGTSANPEIISPEADSVFVNQFTLFENGASSLNWEVGSKTITRELKASIAWDNNGAISLSEVELEAETEGGIEGGQGVVLDIQTVDKGNVVINASDGEKFNLYGMGNSAQWWELHAGEIKFDLYIDSSATDDEGALIIKMDSGWPALGSKELPITDLAKDSWITLSVPINDLLATPGDEALDTNNLVNLFIIEFTSYAHVQVDNVQLICGHKAENGCGINPPAIELDSESVDVFTDEVNAEIWTRGIGAWDSVAMVDYFQGDSNNHVTWQLVESEDVDHGTVLSVNFDDSSADGLIYIQAEQPLDFTDLSQGNLVFDIKVNDYAETTGGMSYKVDCVYPCSTGDQLLGMVGNGEWETITISVSSLINQGLDISSVNTGLVIYPTFGDQKDVSFELDNIRWQVAEENESDGDGVLIYADTVDSNWSLWDCCGGATITEVVDDDIYGNVAEFSFTGQPTVSGVEATDPHDASGLTNGTLEFDLKLTSAPTDATAEWVLKLESVGAATAVEVGLATSLEGANPSLDTWQHYTFDLNSISSQGLDLTQLKLIMIFPTWGKSTGAVYRLDNLILKVEE